MYYKQESNSTNNKTKKWVNKNIPEKKIPMIGLFFTVPIRLKYPNDQDINQSIKIFNWWTSQSIKKRKTIIYGNQEENLFVHIREKSKEFLDQRRRRYIGRGGGNRNSVIWPWRRETNRRGRGTADSLGNGRACHCQFFEKGSLPAHYGRHSFFFSSLLLLFSRPLSLSLLSIYLYPNFLFQQPFAVHTASIGSIDRSTNPNSTKSPKGRACFDRIASSEPKISRN